MIKLNNRIVTIHRTPVFLGNNVFSEVDKLVRTLKANRVYILVDPNTRNYCLPLLLEGSPALSNAQVIETGGGEECKTFDHAVNLWTMLLASGAGRSDLLINLGGGVVSDLGGFVAAGLKRGVRYINIPTTLMGQADAAIGGKTAVNLGHLKNQVGFFHPAEAVFIFPGFLKTLPVDHLRSGLAEIIKCSLVGNNALWQRIRRRQVSRLTALPVDDAFWQEMIRVAVTFKNKVVEKDFREVKLRKVLNFGHTLGHAFESLSFAGHVAPLLHGDAVAAGMVCAAFLSSRKAGLPEADLGIITSCLSEGYEKIAVDSTMKADLLTFLAHDKKASGGKVHFTLISKPGTPLINQACDETEISGAIDYYIGNHR